MKRLKGILFIVVIFLCGVFVGAAIGGTAAMMDLVNKTFRGGPPNIRKILVKRAKHDFKLDEDQTHQFWQIITDAGSEMHQAVKPVRPQIDAALENASRRMSEVLQPSQRARFDSFSNDARERWREALGDTQPQPTVADPAGITPDSGSAEPR